MNLPELQQSGLTTFVQGLRKLGWFDGQNLRIVVRWSASDLNLSQAYATDLVGLFRPDVLLAATTSNLIALHVPPARFPSYSPKSPIRSSKVSCRTWRILSAT